MTASLEDTDENLYATDMRQWPEVSIKFSLEGKAMGPSLLLQVHQHVLLQLMLSATRHKHEPKHKLWQPRHLVWCVPFPGSLYQNGLTLQNVSQEDACPKAAAACHNPVRCLTTIVAMCCVNVQVQLVKDAFTNCLTCS